MSNPLSILALSVRSRAAVAVVTAAALVAGQPTPAPACPFCSAVSLTFAQEIAQSQAAVIGRLVEPPPAGALSPRCTATIPHMPTCRACS